MDEKEPTSLLWAVQLGRQHGHLLTRMRNLETIHHGYDARIKITEGLSEGLKETTGQIQHVTARVHAIEEDDKDIRKWVKQLDGDRQRTVEVESVKITKVLQKMSTMEAQCRDIEASCKQASSDYHAIERRLQHLEDAVAKQNNSSQSPVKKHDNVDVRDLMLKLDTIEAHRSEEMRKSQLLCDRIHSLEKTSQDLQVQSLGLQKEVEQLNRNFKEMKSVAQPIPTDATERSTSSVTSIAQVPASPLPMPTKERYDSARYHQNPDTEVLN